MAIRNCLARDVWLEFNKRFEAEFGVSPIHPNAKMPTGHADALFDPDSQAKIKKMAIESCRVVAEKDISQVYLIWNYEYALQDALYLPKTFPEDDFFENYFRVEFRDGSAISPDPWVTTASICMFGAYRKVV